MAERTPAYDSAADVTVDTDGRNPADIAGVAHPKNLIAARHWNIHADERHELMTLPEFEREEEEFLRTFASPPALDRLASLLDLDYFGLDYAIEAGGEILVFEANCCFRAAWEGRPESPVASHAPAIHRPQLRPVEMAEDCDLRVGALTARTDQGSWHVSESVLPALFWSAVA